MSGSRLTVRYRIDSDSAAIAARAEAIALEQSVELPLAAVRDARVRREVVGEVRAIERVAERAFEVDIALAAETVGADAGQLMNMLFGNASLQPDVTLVDVQLTDEIARRLGGPAFGVAGIRAVTDVAHRPLSCTALKPQGLGAADLALLAGVFARSGIDVIKDDHGLADQVAAPFAVRVPACQRAVDEANAATNGRSVYAPSLTGSLDDLRRQLDVARACGVRMALVAPMIAGASNLQALARDAAMPLMAHPALGGAVRIAPPLLLGKLFRLFGADATIFPNFGGRFSYSREECVAIAAAARAGWHGLPPMLPVPAGGMTVERVPEIERTFGADTMLLIGGSLLVSEDVEARCRAFAAAVRALAPAKDAQNA